MPNPDESIRNTHHSIDELVSRHAEALYSYALMRVREKELAEDMVQETLLAALQNWEDFAGSSSERTWLIGILRHKILDFFRQRRDREQTHDETWRAEHFDKRGHWKVLCAIVSLLAATVPVQADHHIADVVVTVENLVPDGGVYFTPVWLGLHDGSYDLFDVGGLASEALERLAEDGDASVLQAEFEAALGGEMGGMDAVVTAPKGFAGAPIFDPGDAALLQLTINANTNRYLSFVSMIIPSNDAFIGNHNPRAIELFDAGGVFKGKQIITVLGSMVWDAGTELNTEMDAAFINQTEANAGVPTMSPILPHPGYLGSYANPGSDPIILGGTTAAGTLIDPAGADFTLPYAVVARLTVELAPDVEDMP